MKKASGTTIKIDLKKTLFFIFLILIFIIFLPLLQSKVLSYYDRSNKNSAVELELKSNKKLSSLKIPCGQNLGEIRIKLESKLPNTQIDELSCDKVGLYKIKTGQNNFFTDKNVNYLFFGTIYDLNNQQEVSTHKQDIQAQAKQASVKNLDWNDLPLDMAISVGQGSNEIAVWHDINCSYCQRQAEALELIPDVKVHYMFTSILGERTRVPASKILCSDNPIKYFRQYLDNRTLPSSLKTCAKGDAYIDKVLTYGKAKGWQGTPVTVRKKDGKIRHGFRNQQSLESFIKGE